MRSLPLVALKSIVSLTTLFLFSCSPAFRDVAPDPTRVAGYSYQNITGKAPIRILFTATSGIAGRIETPCPFQFDPPMQGSATWTTDRTLEFVPDRPWNKDQRYRVQVSGSGVSLFTFVFRTEMPRLGVKNVRLEAANDETFDLRGTLTWSDGVDFADVQTDLEAKQDGRKLALAWEKVGKGQRDFAFKEIKKKDRSGSVELSWNGSGVEVQGHGRESLAVPVAGDFEVLAIRPVAGAERYVEALFSDLLDKNQDLTGLTSLASEPSSTQLRAVRDGSRLKIYNADGWNPKATVRLDRSIRSVHGKTLTAVAEQKIEFDQALPAVRFLGQGTVLPTSQGLTLPIETENLRGVSVDVMQIYGDNMTQFLQVNNLDGSDELRRVGRMVWTAHLSFSTTDAEKNQWVRRGLDLTPLVKNHPGGFYRIRVYFGPLDIVWEGNRNPDLDQVVSKSDQWTRYDAEVYDEDWRARQDKYEQRFNPLHPGFYRSFDDHDINIWRNVLISDVGLTAKKDDDRWVLFATNLKTAKPWPGIPVTVYDYQSQVLLKGKTDSKGSLEFSVSETPSFIAADNGDQRSWLKVDAGSSLSVSSFDVGGTVNSQGVDGFLYGERGVWRPGDALYIDFILSDPRGVLPKNHPVVLDLINPFGQIVSTQTKTDSVGGFYSFPASTDPEAPTGNWTARAKIGDRIWEMPVRIAAVVPNRLKADLQWSSANDVLPAGPETAVLSAQWLHGAPASNLGADIKAIYSAGTTHFSSFPDFHFDDPAKTFDRDERQIWAGTLDESGKANLSAQLGVESQFSPGFLNTTFQIRIFEPSGAFSTETRSAIVSPYTTYVGIRMPKPETPWGAYWSAKDYPVSLVAVDRDGRPKAGLTQVQIEVAQVNWDWWWEQGEQTLAQYVASQNYHPLLQDTLTLRDGKGTWNFRSKVNWGRFLIRVKDPAGGHSTGETFYVYWPYGETAPSTQGPGGAAALLLSTDKTKYKVGETVSVSFPSNSGGTALAQLEVDGRIVDSEWIDGKEGTTSYRFSATSEMAPNAYVHVSFLQPHLQTQNDLPLRLYGVIPIFVENSQSRLQPVIESSDSFEPGSTVEVAVRETSGYPMTYTLAIVDEGLLGLTNFSTPDAWSYFFRRVASRVSSWDLYDQVAGAFSGKLDTLLAIGGDASLLDMGKKKADRFPPVVQVLEPRTLAPGGGNVHKITLPQYIGQVRLMVVAAQADRRIFGRAEKSVTVKSPLMVLTTLPRVLTPGESLNMPVTIFAYDPTIRRVNLDLETTGPIQAVHKTNVVAVQQQGEITVPLEIKVSDNPGTATLRLHASSGTFQTVSETAIEVRLPTAAITKVASQSLNPGQTWEKNLDLPGLSGTNKATVEVSSIPPLDLGRRLDYLIEYPYGCIEQTTSAVFPQLGLNRLLTLSKERSDKIQRDIRAGIERLKLFQTPEGGFSFWPGEPEVNPWGTNYAGHFLLEAFRQGYDVPQIMLQKWTAYQKQAVQDWKNGSSWGGLDQAYRLFTLALAGSPELGAMNRLKENLTSLETAAQWRLAEAYALAGQRQAALSIADSLSLRFPVYHETGGSFGNDVRDKAMVLESLAEMNLPTPAVPLAQDLSEALTSEDDLSTQTIAYALIAMTRFASMSGVDQPLRWEATWNGRDLNVVPQKSPLSQMDLAVGDEPSGRLSVKNLGSGVLFVRLQSSGFPGLGQEKATSRGLSLNVHYQVEDKVLDQESVEDFPLGKDLTVNVEVTNNTRRRVEQIVLDQLLPSGLEVADSRVLLSAPSPRPQDNGNDGDASSSTPASPFDFQDYRDDRVFTFFSLDPGETKTVTLTLNSTYQGRFWMPLVLVKAMYDASYQAVVPGHWFTIGAGSRTGGHPR